MRKAILIILLFLLLLGTAQAQEPGPIYLPLITKRFVSECVEDDVSNWYVIIPEQTVNYVLNPSAETTGNYSVSGAATITRLSTYQRYGLYSYRFQTAGDNEGADFTLGTLTNAIHYATLRVRGTLPNSWDWALDGASYAAPTLLEQVTANWALYGLQFPAAQASGSTTFSIRQNGAGAGDFYVDGIQVEAKSYWTTYTDGDQEGSQWNGEEHASTSTRSAGTTAGGRQRDLQDVYYFDVGGMIGTGTAPRSVVMDEYAILPGGEVNTVKTHARPFTLTGVVRGSSYSDMHTKLANLESALSPSETQPVRLRYTGSSTHKECAAFYEGGMEGNVQATEVCYWQRMAVRFIAPDPYWYDYGGSGEGGAGSAATLDTNDSATTRLLVARLRSTGQWDDMGPPSSFGTEIDVKVIRVGPEDKKVYFGGDFTNCDGTAAADYVAVYDPLADSYAALGGGLNGIVYYGMAFDSDGILYVGGSFTNAGGDGQADYVAQIDPLAAAPAWSNVGGGPGAGTVVGVADLLFDINGNLYVAGDFTNWDGDGDADYIVMWDGTSWSPLGTGMDGIVYTLALDKDGTTVYAGGSFTTAGGVSANDIAAWDGSSWSALGSGSDGIVYDLAVNSRNELYAGGTFDNISGVAAAKIAMWNGTAWSALGSGVDTGVSVYTIEVAPDDVLWVGGNFSEIGGVTADEFARWNGVSWAHVDIILPATQVNTVTFGDPDPVIRENYDVWLGYMNPTGATYFSGSTTVTNNGTEVAYPVIVFERSGGTTATIYQVRNETMGKELLFDYDLLDGERLTIDLRPTQQSIVSSMFGSRPDAILANSDMGDFVLQPGENLVTAFVNVTGSPTITAWMEWRMKYKGL